MEHTSEVIQTDIHKYPPGSFRQVLIFGDGQRIASMAEGLQVGHQFYVVLAAERVQFEDVLVGEGTAASPDLGVTWKPEGMLGVELQDVELVMAEFCNQVSKCVQRRDFATGDVEHQAAIG